MSGYAAGTTVSEDRSRAELEKLLHKYGADQFMYARDSASNRQVVAFRIAGRSVQLDVPVPSRTDPTICQTPSGRARSGSAIEEEYAKEVRRRWRALVAVVKAKLVAVADGISTLEREFLADMLTEDGRKVEEIMRPHLAAGGPLQLTRVSR